MLRSTKRACTAIAESDSSDSSSEYESCQLFQTTNVFLQPLYALKNTLQSSIISDHEYQRAIEEQYERAIEDPTDINEPICIKVIQQLLNNKAFHTVVMVAPEEYMVMTTIPNGRFIVHDNLENRWFAIRRSSQRQSALLLDASLDTIKKTWSFGEMISEHHDLYQVKMNQPFKRMCSTPAKTARQLNETTESFSQTSISQDNSQESTDFSISNENELPTDNDVETENDTISKKFHKLLSKIKLHQCVYCMEVVSTNRNVKDVKSFRCPKCLVICKKDKVNFWETEAGHPGFLPDVLKNNPLTFVEEQLVSLVCVNQYIYNRRTGVIASKGHCIHFMQDISVVARVLPRLPADVPIVIIQKKNWVGETTRDLRVRRSVVRLWLEFLKANNRLRAYRSLQIDEERLNNLPVDSFLPEIQIIETDNELETVATFERDSLQEERPDTDDANPAFDSAVPIHLSEIPSEQTNLEETVTGIISGNCLHHMHI